MMHATRSTSSMTARPGRAASPRAAGAPARARNARETLGLVAAVVLAAGFAGARTASVAAETWTPPDTFTATTTAMVPADLGLKIDVKEWSDDAARADVLAAIADDASALADLPTVGYVWVNGSGVGYALKYAHRESTSGGERITFVTDRAVGSYDFEPWTPGDATKANDLAYSVIELDLDAQGQGDGTMSLAAGVSVDADAETVSLDPSAPRLLTGAKAEPKPYWARGN